MTDERLAELAEEYVRLKRREEKAKTARESLGKKLVKEMERRGTRGIATSGWRITYVQQETTWYDPEKLRQKLGQKFKLVAAEVVDKDKLSAAVQEGEIDPRKVAACATVLPKAAYVLVNPDN